MFFLGFFWPVLPFFAIGGAYLRYRYLSLERFREHLPGEFEAMRNASVPALRTRVQQLSGQIQDPELVLWACRAVSTERLFAVVGIAAVLLVWIQIIGFLRENWAW